MLGSCNYSKSRQGASGRRLSEPRWVQFVKCQQNLEEQSACNRLLKIRCRTLDNATSAEIRSDCSAKP